MTNSVKILRGENGFGGPLILTVTEKRTKIVLVTGEKTNPVAEKISDLTGATIIDGFSSGIPCEEMLVAIVDCSGTARCGIYPKKGIKIINLSIADDYGPLADYIVPEYYVSDISTECVYPTDEVESEERAGVHPEGCKSDPSSMYAFKPVLQEHLIIKKIPPEKKELKSIFKGLFNK
ncbi:MAG: hypothetical protein ACRDA4_03025 [Filifactoraceae bacterium]